MVFVRPSVNRTHTHTLAKANSLATIHSWRTIGETLPKNREAAAAAKAGGGWFVVVCVCALKERAHPSDGACVRLCACLFTLAKPIM